MRVHWPMLMLVATLACAPGHPSAAGRDEAAAPAEAKPARIAEFHGRRAVRLSAAAQAQSGIELVVPQAAEWRPEFAVQGRVADIQPLLQLRAQYNQTLAERDAAATAFDASDSALRRLGTLRESGAGVSARQLQEARTQRGADQSRVRAAETRLRDLHDQTLHDWGPVLTGWTLQTGSDALESFIRQQDVLLLIAFGPEQSLAEGVSQIPFSRSSDRLGATPATLISAAPFTGVTMGETYFFRAPAGALRTGMPVYAWAPGGAAAVRGVFVPDSAVVWLEGRPWVYVRHDRDLFARHPLAGESVLGGRWFVPDLALSGAEVVRAGAQTLLSEESRGEIPDEDDNP